MKVLIFGSKGMVGSSTARQLKANKSLDVIESTRLDTNLFSLEETKKFVEKNMPDIVVNCAAKVGGIVANNTNRTDFILNNLKINMNIIESLINFPKVKLINLGSSCIYPLGAEIPINESSLMKGSLEPTNSPYAMAKLAAIEMGDAISKEYGHRVVNLMPTNLYGPGDNFSELDSHVIPGLIFRMNEAKRNNLMSFSVWGTGKPLREFLYVEDLAKAIDFVISKNIDNGLFNIGSNEEVSIKELVYKIKEVIGFKGDILFDTSKPDGNPRKLLDSKKFKKLGWAPSVNLNTGLKLTYNWYQNNCNN